MLQMDLKKAYDTVELSALETILKELSFRSKFIRWIVITIITPSYKYKVNGEHTSIMKTKIGLRQGDLLSSLLFVIVMGICTGFYGDLSVIPISISIPNVRSLT